MAKATRAKSVKGNTNSRMKLARAMEAEGRANAQARAKALVALIEHRVVTIVEGFYDIGEVLLEIVDRKLSLLSVRQEKPG